MVIPIFLGIYLTLQTYIQPQSKNLIAVNGIAQIDNGNHYDINKKNSRTPLPISEIIAIKGKVKATLFNAKISIEDIGREKINTSTNKDGRFLFHLRPGIYTFFIVKKDKAYLNRFDGYGYFQSIKIEKPISDLLLIDDEESLN